MSIVKRPESDLFKFLFRDLLKKENVMQNHFQMNIKKSNGDLHVRAQGSFNGNSAWELLNLLHATYKGKGRIFVDTRHLQEVFPFGCDIFKNYLDKGIVPPEILYFKGENGFAMAPTGSKVLKIAEKSRHGCKGNCVNCKCNVRKKKKVGKRVVPLEKIAV
ncbi:hypothetical protein SAMN02746065_101330 [Desulfocicer vacuolatum DSM 3385]|uniref:Uncharacterized protein n=1 Tax=Desulfocicer vacuolatum DSM 3385 TaxID=1121400 RepID=A0A1W1YST9_9BACT|nr:hypothetical protein [Desulfocicer vacuolatum]SMC39204.1 hypothetical protein SAMN02746065_101330 [Desulfocicer vacuolatum DSM 3385]